MEMYSWTFKHRTPPNRLVVAEAATFRFSCLQEDANERNMVKIFNSKQCGESERNVQQWSRYELATRTTLPSCLPRSIRRSLLSKGRCRLGCFFVAFVGALCLWSLGPAAVGVVASSTACVFGFASSVTPVLNRSPKGEVKRLQ